MAYVIDLLYRMYTSYHHINNILTSVLWYFWQWNKISSSGHALLNRILERKEFLLIIAIVDGLIICGINNLVCSDAGLLMLLFMCAVLSISETNQNTVKGERRR